MPPLNPLGWPFPQSPSEDPSWPPLLPPGPSPPVPTGHSPTSQSPPAHDVPSLPMASTQAFLEPLSSHLNTLTHTHTHAHACTHTHLCDTRTHTCAHAHSCAHSPVCSHLRTRLLTHTRTHMQHVSLTSSASSCVMVAVCPSSPTLWVLVFWFCAQQRSGRAGRAQGRLCVVNGHTRAPGRPLPKELPKHMHFTQDTPPPLAGSVSKISEPIPQTLLWKLKNSSRD